MFSKLYLSLLDCHGARIVRSGDFKSIQEFRLKVEKYYRWHYDGFLNRGSLEKRLFEIWKLDFALRGAIQANRYLTQQKVVLGRRKHVKTRDIELLAKTQRMIAQSYVLLCQALYRAEETLPDVPVKRAYLLLRKDPLWYLHPALIDECVRKGGCCGRPCNRCQKRRPKEGQRLGVGHCTMLCACCLNTIGVSYEDSNLEMGPAVLDFWFQPFGGGLSNNVLWQKIRQAFFFGLR